MVCGSRLGAADQILPELLEQWDALEPDATGRVGAATDVSLADGVQPYPEGPVGKADSDRVGQTSSLYSFSMITARSGPFQ
jgi:hypothetical protein